MQAVDTEKGKLVAAELDAIGKEMMRSNLTPNERLELRERLRKARKLWSQAVKEVSNG